MEKSWNYPDMGKFVVNCVSVFPGSTVHKRLVKFFPSSAGWSRSQLHEVSPTSKHTSPTKRFLQQKVPMVIDVVSSTWDPPDDSTS